MYELGRIKGQLCKTEEARLLLVAALKQADSSRLSVRDRLPRILEIAYLASSADRYEAALPYFERGIASARSAGSDKDSEFSDVLQAYAVALRQTGARDQADGVSREALAARDALQPELQPPLTLRYRVGCATTEIKRGDYDEALRHHRTVLEEGLPEEDRARFILSIYEAGRAAGVLCRFAEAEAYLLEALALDQANAGLVHFDLVELARLALDQQKYVESAAYFARALPILEGIQAESDAPIEFANILEEYALALSRSDQPEKAEEKNARAAAIRARTPRGASITERTPYGSECAQETN